MDWFLYDIDLRHESVKQQFPTFTDCDICDILFNCLKNAQAKIKDISEATRGKNE